MDVMTKQDIDGVLGILRPISGTTLLSEGGVASVQGIIECIERLEGQIDEARFVLSGWCKIAEERFPYRNGETLIEDWRPTDDTVRPIPYGMIRDLAKLHQRLSREDAR